MGRIGSDNGVFALLVLGKEDGLTDAFVLRIKLNDVDRVQEALETNDVFIGWGKAKDLFDPSLEKEEFRQIIHDNHYAEEGTYRRSGAAAGNLWRFIREMKPGDYVVVPGGSEFPGRFFIAKVVGEAHYDEDDEDVSYRRRVEWLNDKESIPRKYARAALQRKMKAYGTCTRATNLVEEIQEVVEVVKKDETPSFEKNLRLRLVEQTLDEIRAGHMNDYGFERLVETVLKSLGAAEVRVLSRSKEDKGADIVANFPLAATFDFVLAVQAKHYQPDPPIGVEIVEQLERGMETEGADLGWVVTSGRFSEEAFAKEEEIEEERGFRIELVDGEQLAAMIVEGGLKEMPE